MPPCGNFGLLLLGKNECDSERRPLPPQTKDAGDASVIQRETMKAVSETGGLVLAQDLPSHLYLNSGGGDGGSAPPSPSVSSRKILPRKFHYVQPDLHTPLKIMESMTAMTEIRGGQAGGYSVIEHTNKEALMRGELPPDPVVKRVRAVARKRVPLAGDLTKKYLEETGGHDPLPTTPSLSCIGHTRFATSSVNVVPELHPHEWTPWRHEEVWRLNPISGIWAHDSVLCGVHITHNGDFDALECYSTKLTNSELGHWLERVLAFPNKQRGDSPKIAGMLDLLRVQGRWGASARLAWVRCVTMQATDVTDGMQLTNDAPNKFPPAQLWAKWSVFLNIVWLEHMDAVIDIHSPDGEARDKHLTYSIVLEEERAFVAALVKALESDDERFLKPGGFGYGEGFSLFGKGAGAGPGPGAGAGARAGTGEGKGAGAKAGREKDDDGASVDSNDSQWSDVEVGGGKNLFAAKHRTKPPPSASPPGAKLPPPVQKSHTGGSLKKELKADHWDGKTMRNFFTACVRGFLRSDLYTSMCELLSRAEGSFGLQAHTSLEQGVVVIASKGQPMSMAFDPVLPLCLFGSEAGALGVPVDKGGRWLSRRIDLDNQGEVVRVGEPRILNDGNYLGVSSRAHSELKAAPDHLTLQCGIQIKSYSLVSCLEARLPELLGRILHVNATVKGFDPKVDLISADLDCTPAVLASIDRVWGTPHSLENNAARSLSIALVDCMRERLKNREETTDLVISGVEASLWLAEAFSADLRTIFPQANIVTLSSNKLLGLGLPRCASVFFPGSIVVEEKLLSSKTCFLLITQSGQTFPVLHGSSNTARFTHGGRLWLMTATFNSRCEKVIQDDFASNGCKYSNDRVFNICCGHRPAEPSSVVVAATWHSLSRLLLYLIKHVQVNCPEGMLVHSWDRGGRASPKDEFKDETTTTASASPTATTIDTRPCVAMKLSPGCIDDIQALLDDYLVSNVAEIVGVAAVPQLSHVGHGELTTYERLVQQGKCWGEHVREPWTVLVLVGGYIMLSVGLGLPLFGLLGDALVAILRAASVDLGEGSLAFSPRNTSIMYLQHWGWTIAGLCLQVIDAAWFVYLAKTFTRLCRWSAGRPLWARYGKRTIVIVDTPTNHQLLESFVSKLFSQSYSHTSVDVHGASGLDHFVHRFTHRVVRGVLLAAGRCDGRIGCLAKSELATLLSLKQAAFITNPDYPDSPSAEANSFLWPNLSGSGPEIVTVGHNPYTASLGLASHQICIESRLKRRPFMEEYLFERLHLAAKPFTAILLKSLREQHLLNQQNRDAAREWRGQKKLPYGVHHIGPHSDRGGSLLLQFMQQAKEQMNRRKSTVVRINGAGNQVGARDIINMLRSSFNSGSGKFTESLSSMFSTPSGTPFSSPRSPSKKSISPMSPATLSQKLMNKNLLVARSKAGSVTSASASASAAAGAGGPKALGTAALANIQPSNDPSAREAFFLRFDANAQAVLDAEMTVQHIYESRIAALERYVAFCVMFHAMAAHCNKPWLLWPWDIARSQSNLRVATTGEWAGGGVV